LEQAQKDKQAEVVECLTKKLTPMRALVDITRASSNTMQTYLAANDGIHADGEFRKIAVALSKVREFLQDALTCGGSTGGKTAASVASINQTVDDLADGAEIDQGINPIDDAPIPSSPQ
jgi:methyl-accepting chemotaxis protein